MYKKHSGLTRTYLPTFGLREQIPEVKDIIANTPTGKKFANHVALNHKGLNWKIFRFNMNSSNYKSFVFSLAIIASKSTPSHSAIWQLESNARRLQKNLIKKNIKLTAEEQEIIEICKNFSRWHSTYFFREKKLNSLISSSLKLMCL